jgi:DNA polymerase III alpha subunit
VTYAELHCHSNFSFLEGASHPVELAQQAKELGLPALAITDRGGLYGAVRFLLACKDVGVHPVIGSCLEVDGHDLVLLARSRDGYSNLSRLISLAHRDHPKGEARTTLETLDAHRQDLICLAAPVAGLMGRSLVWLRAALVNPRLAFFVILLAF